MPEIKKINQKKVCIKMKNTNLDAVLINPVTEAVDILVEHDDWFHRRGLEVPRNASLRLPKGYKEFTLEVRLVDHV